MNESDVFLDKSAGQVNFPRGRAFMLGSDVWANLKLKQSWDPQSVEGYKRRWVDYGRELGKITWEAVGREIDVAYDTLQETAAQVGWGVMTVEGELLHGTHLTFKLENCVFCHGLKGKFTHPVCYEFTGVIQGIVEVFYGTRTVIETNCATGVWKACEVEVSR